MAENLEYNAAAQAMDHFESIGITKNTKNQINIVLNGFETDKESQFDKNIVAFAYGLEKEFAKAGIKLTGGAQLDRVIPDDGKSRPSCTVAYVYESNPEVLNVFAKALQQTQHVIRPDLSPYLSQPSAQPTPATEPDLRQTVRAQPQSIVEEVADEEERPSFRSKFKSIVGGLKLLKGLNKGGPYLTDMGFDRSVKFKKINGKYGLHRNKGDEEIIESVFGDDPDLKSRIFQVAWNKKHDRPTFLFDTGEVLQAAYHTQADGTKKLSALIFSHDHVDPSSGEALMDAWEKSGHSIDNMHVHGSRAFIKNMTHALDMEKVRRKQELLESVEGWKATYGSDPNTAKLLEGIEKTLKDGSPLISKVTEVLRENVWTHKLSDSAPDFERMAKLLNGETVAKPKTENTIKPALVTKPKAVAA